ncbi:MAG: Uma2 family endonuclease [Anaerolineae bacterium]|nr:Uma2 family endonuclease [Anaerolineae bacterium]
MTTFHKYMTPEEHLALDRAAPTKSEYIDGVIVAMAGASLEHNLIVANVGRALWGQLRGPPCRIVPCDTRVFVPATGNYVYPDATVGCQLSLTVVYDRVTFDPPSTP